MRYLLLTLFTACICNVAGAVEATATGYGHTADEALQNAKVLATEYAASTFLTGKKELINGEYKETLGQYNGGLIKSYVVKSTSASTNGYEVTIDADVDSDKVNAIITTGNTAPSEVSNQLEKSISEYGQTRAAFIAVSNVSPMFGVEVDAVNYESRGNVVMVSYHAHLKWSPKWIDDMETLVKTIDRPIPVSTATTDLLYIAGVLSTIFNPMAYSTIFNAARASENKPTPDDAICFTSDPKKGLDSCYGVLKLPPYEAIPKLINVRATVNFHDGHHSTKCFAVGNSNSNGMYVFFNAGTTGMFRYSQRKFPTDSLVLYKNNVHPFIVTAQTTAEKLKLVSDVTFDVVSNTTKCDL